MWVIYVGVDGVIPDKKKKSDRSTLQHFHGDTSGKKKPRSNGGTQSLTPFWRAIKE